MVGIIWNGTLRHNSIFGAARAAGRGLYSIRMRMNNRKFVKLWSCDYEYATRKTKVNCAVQLVRAGLAIEQPRL